MTDNPLTYAVEQRLRFIDFLLHHYGNVNRAAVMDYFGMGPASATRDLEQYQKLAPGNAVYDSVAKSYIKGLEFKRVWP